MDSLKRPSSGLQAPKDMQKGVLKSGSLYVVWNCYCDSSVLADKLLILDTAHEQGPALFHYSKATW